MKLKVKVKDIAFGTSIQDVKVPDILKKRISTGIDYFDSVIGGEGFTPSMCTFFTGSPGAGKTTMMLSLANSLQGNGAQVVFNTAEESLYQIKMTANRLKLRHPFAVGGENNIPSLIKGCDTLRKANPDKPFFLIVDSLQCMEDGHFNNGRITTRHIGGGHKQHYRIIDFKRTKDGIPAKVERIEYDPNRTAHIALLLFADGERRYIIAPKGIKAGDSLQSGAAASIKAGNCLPLRNIPVGSVVHCIELKPGKGAQIARSAGASVQLVAREGQYATLRLRSGEMRKVLSDCRATLGEVSNSEHSLRKLGKAGAARWRGVRPTVRGVAMNPVDHPHGGGEGRTSGGRHPVSPWGTPTKGYKTRKNKRTDKLIVRRRGAK